MSLKYEPASVPQVLTIVEQQTLAPKVYIFKMKRRKNSRRFRGFRASVTQLRIMKISVPERTESPLGAATSGTESPLNAAIREVAERDQASA